MKILNSENFSDEIASQSGLVLVDFFAEWCGPCKAIAPLLDQMEALFDDLTIFKVDIEASPDLAQSFMITGVPTFKFIRNNQVIYTQVGVLDPSSLTSLIRSLYDNAPAQT
mgnify:CR=1 FL=1